MIAKKVPVTVHTYHITEITEDEITTILTALRRMMTRSDSYTGRLSVPTTADRMKAREVFGKLDEMHRSVVPKDLVDLIEGPDADEDEDDQ